MGAELVGGGEGLALLDETATRTAATEARLFVPESHRTTGVLLAGISDVAGAEAELTRAVDVAREQGAKHWELRAATCLARHRRDQGRSLAARELLAPVYGWFTEDVDPPDLRNTRALLDQLA